ncbi:3-phosphoshikimate 1-carboxyvinyltransferase [Nitratireductor sp. CAU 1489]|uniref:3-phosphoshikimate 1-carboxyvinyltransferase n=2 Tax=Nitratireductor arenosus TaxID=2682096 RepID=A0A844QIW8_9HYPH|nr:3-phosphoshikimate 1-carboxyvinyltransferase [Nitratireductor arenosus]
MCRRTILCLFLLVNLMTIAPPAVSARGRSPIFEPSLPGSKSLTNRALALAAARKGKTRVVGALHADDTVRFADCINRFGGLSVAADTCRAAFHVENSCPGERPLAPHEPLDIGAAGTPARFLLSMAADAEGETTITGTRRLCERPMASGIEALRALGRPVLETGNPGCLPVRIVGGRPTDTYWRVDGSVSSQFTSSMLLSAARQDADRGPVHVEATGNLVSRPYVDMTVQTMRAAGIDIGAVGPQTWRVLPQRPDVASIAVEPDASAMSYFLGAAAILGGAVRISGVGSSSAQGDVGFVHVLEEMGCAVSVTPTDIELRGPEGALRGIEVDLETMPDMVLTLAVVAAFAQGRTKIVNIANLRLKECDRLHAAAQELQRIGIRAQEGPDWLEIAPDGTGPRPASVHTYDDHRVAMAFSLAALTNKEITIEDPACVAKSFPDYWSEYARLAESYGLAR